VKTLWRWAEGTGAEVSIQNRTMTLNGKGQVFQRGKGATEAIKDPETCFVISATSNSKYKEEM